MRERVKCESNPNRAWELQHNHSPYTAGREKAAQLTAARVFTEELVFG